MRPVSARAEVSATRAPYVLAGSGVNVTRPMSSAVRVDHGASVCRDGRRALGAPAARAGRLGRRPLVGQARRPPWGSHGSRQYGDSRRTGVGSSQNGAGGGPSASALPLKPLRADLRKLMFSTLGEPTSRSPARGSDRGADFLGGPGHPQPGTGTSSGAGRRRSIYGIPCATIAPSTMTAESDSEETHRHPEGRSLAARVPGWSEQDDPHFRLAPGLIAPRLGIPPGRPARGLEVGGATGHRSSARRSRVGRAEDRDRRPPCPKVPPICRVNVADAVAATRIAAVTRPG